MNGSELGVEVACSGALLAWFERRAESVYAPERHVLGEAAVVRLFASMTIAADSP